jgi:hypothetical protein
MTTTPWPPWRRAWLRHGLTAGFLLAAAMMGIDAGCNDDWAGLAMLPWVAVQSLGVVVSLGLALFEWIRRKYRDALAEVGVAVLMVLSIGAGPTVMRAFIVGGCE